MVERKLNEGTPFETSVKFDESKKSRFNEVDISELVGLEDANKMTRAPLPKLKFGGILGADNNLGCEVPVEDDNHPDGYVMKRMANTVEKEEILLPTTRDFAAHPVHEGKCRDKLIGLLVNNKTKFDIIVTIFITVKGVTEVIAKAVKVPTGQTMVGCGKDFAFPVEKIGGYYRTDPFKSFKNNTAPMVVARMFFTT